jgi:hypothetical protein
MTQLSYHQVNTGNSGLCIHMLMAELRQIIQLIIIMFVKRNQVIPL